METLNVSMNRDETRKSVDMLSNTELSSSSKNNATNHLQITIDFIIKFRHMTSNQMF